MQPANNYSGYGMGGGRGAYKKKSGGVGKLGGQPVVIGGVEITHKDQKVSIFGDCSLF